MTQLNQIKFHFDCYPDNLADPAKCKFRSLFHLETD